MKYILFLVFILSSAQASLKSYNFQDLIMACEFRILIYHESEEKARQAAKKAFARIASIEKICSDYQSNSEVSQLSNTVNTWVPVSKELWAVLYYAQDLAEKSHGAFDVSCGPLSVQWRMARFQNKLPKPQVLSRSLKRCGYKNIHLDTASQSIKLLQPQMKLDLGALGKGYAADEAMKILRKEQITYAMIDAGGDLLMTEHPSGQWKIYIDEQEYIEVQRGAVATSGNRQQKFTLGDQTYSHIIDPRTGKALTYNQQVTAMAPTAMQADALASTFSVLNEQERMNFLENNKGFSIILYNDKKIFTTSNFPSIQKD